MSGKQQTQGCMDTDRWIDSAHLTSRRHQSPWHTTGHFLASKPAFDLEFVIYHHNHGEREEAQQVISWQGGKKSFKMWHFCSALKAESAWRDACAKSVAFHIKPSRKKKTQTHLANTGRWQGDGRATVASHWCSYSSPSALSFWFRSREKKYESNHLNITLSQRKIIPYSLEK